MVGNQAISMGRWVAYLCTQLERDSKIKACLRERFLLFSMLQIPTWREGWEEKMPEVELMQNG